MKIKSNHSPKLNNTMFDPQWAYGKYEKKKKQKTGVFREREKMPRAIHVVRTYENHKIQGCY